MARGPSLWVPSDRASFRAHVAVLVILSFETAWWLPQPCVGDIVCAPVIGFFTAFGLIPLAVTFLVWRAAGRASAVVVVDALIIAAVAPLMPSLLQSGGLTNIIALLLLAVPFLLAYGAMGAAADLTPHLSERIGAAVVLGAIAVWLIVIGVPVLALTVILAAGLVGSGVFRRREPELAEADATEAWETD